MKTPIFALAVAAQNLYNKNDTMKLYYKKLVSAITDQSLSHLQFPCQATQEYYTTIVYSVKAGRYHQRRSESLFRRRDPCAFAKQMFPFMHSGRFETRKAKKYD